MEGTGFTRHGAPPGPFMPKELTFGLMLCFCYLGILSHFVFQLVFCKSGAMGPGSRCMNKRDVRSICVLATIPGCPFVYSVCDTPGAQNSGGPTVRGVLSVHYYLWVAFKFELA